MKITNLLNKSKKILALTLVGYFSIFPATALAGGPIPVSAPVTVPVPIPAPTMPDMIYPQNGQTLDLEGAYMFKVTQLAGASGYLFGLFQDGQMVYENYRDNRNLSPNGEFNVWENNPFHNRFHTGNVKVMIRGLINNNWTDAREITIYLRPRIVTPTPSPTPVPSPTSSYYIDPQPTNSIIMVAPSAPNSGYAVFALLKNRLDGSVITNQQNLDYNWTVEKFDPNQEINLVPFSGCTNGIQQPCPNDHATISVPKVGYTSSANVWVTVTNRSTGTILAKEEFVLNFVSANAYVSISQIKPGYTPSENYTVGQQVNISWNMNGQPVDYYNIYYQYYEGGILKGGYVNSPTYPLISTSWVIPQELAGRQPRIIIEARKNGIIVGKSNSDWSFIVTTPNIGIGTTNSNIGIGTTNSIGIGVKNRNIVNNTTSSNNVVNKNIVNSTNLVKTKSTPLPAPVKRSQQTIRQLNYLKSFIQRFLGR